MQIQILHGKCNPRTGQPRTIALVWDGDQVVDRGDEAVIRNRYKGTPIRDIEVWIKLKDMAHLERADPPYGNPLTMR